MSATLHVAAFTQGQTIPSARFRVQQYQRLLQAQQIDLRELPALHGSYPPSGLVARLNWLPRAWCERSQALAQASHWADVALFQREMISTLASGEPRWRARYHKPAVLDVDDAIWLTQRFGGVDKIARSMNLIICGNAFLADYFGRFAPTCIIPTAVDTERFTAGARSQTPVIVWSGSASGLDYLHALEAVFVRVFAAVPQAKLRVVSNQRPCFTQLAPEHVQFIPWSPDNEVAALQSAWAGLMPMPDTLWTRGKCSYKMLTYMSCAVPAVVSPWGMNAQVLAQGEGALGALNAAAWEQTLIDLLRAPASQIEQLGQSARRMVEANYSLTVLGAQFAQVLKSFK